MTKNLFHFCGGAWSALLALPAQTHFQPMGGIRIKGRNPVWVSNWRSEISSRCSKNIRTDRGLYHQNLSHNFSGGRGLYHQNLPHHFPRDRGLYHQNLSQGIEGYTIRTSPITLSTHGLPVNNLFSFLRWCLISTASPSCTNPFKSYGGYSNKRAKSFAGVELTIRNLLLAGLGSCFCGCVYESICVCLCVYVCVCGFLCECLCEWVSMSMCTCVRACACVCFLWVWMQVRWRFCVGVCVRGCVRVLYILFNHFPEKGW